MTTMKSMRWCIIGLLAFALVAAPAACGGAGKASEVAGKWTLTEAPDIELSTGWFVGWSDNIGKTVEFLNDGTVVIGESRETYSMLDDGRLSVAFGGGLGDTYVYSIKRDGDTMTLLDSGDQTVAVLEKQ